MLLKMVQVFDVLKENLRYWSQISVAVMVLLQMPKNKRRLAAA